ncbi:MAG: hypothetical protein AAGE52_32370, partial [Myxococcota bacterium]
DAGFDARPSESPFATMPRSETRCDPRFPDFAGVEIPDEGGVFTGDTAEGETAFPCPEGGRSDLYRIQGSLTRYYRVVLTPANPTVDVNLQFFNSCRDSGACGSPAGAAGPGEVEMREIFVVGHDEDAYILVSSPPGFEGAYELQVEDLGAVLQFVAEEIELPLIEAEATESVGLDVDGVVSEGGDACHERADRTSEDVPGGGVDNEAAAVLFLINDLLEGTFDPNRDIADVIANGRYFGIELTGVHSLENDDDVGVTVARVHSTERNRLDDIYLPLEADEDGFILPGQGIIVREPATPSPSRGRIVDGVLEAEISLLLSDARTETDVSYMQLSIPGQELIVRRALLRMPIADNYIRNATLAVELPLEELIDSLPDIDFLATTLGEAADLLPEGGECRALSGALRFRGPWVDYRFYFGFDADCEKFCDRSVVECEIESRSECMTRCSGSRERERRCAFSATTCEEVAACEL